MNIVQHFIEGILEEMLAPIHDISKLFIAFILAIIGAILLPIRVGMVVDDFQSKLDILSFVLNLPVGDIIKAIIGLALVILFLK